MIKAITIAIVLFFVCLLIMFRGSLGTALQDSLQEDRNPQLVSYLQGNWAMEHAKNIFIRIKRDTLFEQDNDSSRHINRLHYVFSQSAGLYFNADSSFHFTKAGKPVEDFTLIATNNLKQEQHVYVLSFVSKSQLIMHCAGKSLQLYRMKD